MGNLKPGATYIYENSDGIIYAREMNSDPSTRFEIGRTADRQKSDKEFNERKLWKDICETAQSNAVLHDAIERVKIIYELSKDNGKK